MVVSYIIVFIEGDEFFHHAAGWVRFTVTGRQDAVVSDTGGRRISQGCAA